MFHSLRHSFRNRLRSVECPFDIIDRLGVWLTAGVGQSYGKGYPLGVLNRWKSKIRLTKYLILSSIIQS